MFWSSRDAKENHNELVVSHMRSTDDSHEAALSARVSAKSLRNIKFLCLEKFFSISNSGDVKKL